MKRDLFGTDGVRGLAGQYPLDSAGTQQIGRAVGMYFAKPGEQVVVACDTRESSGQLVTDITEGLTAVGVDVVFIGVLPTPGLAYIAREYLDFVAGIMITASHNPYQYNGIKVFDGHGDKLSDETEVALNALIDSSIPDRAVGTELVNDQISSVYEDFLVASAEGLQLNGMKLAIDSANGAASGIAERVFTRLGASVTALFDTPDGKNINANCGATHTEALAKTVVEQKLDMGIALDGDADRIMLIDSLGRQLNGDYIIYLLAVTRNLKGVVLTVMANLGLEKALHERQIATERVAVGDRYVLEGLSQTHYELGGEQSGHIILPQLLATGDALLAAVQTVRALNVSDVTTLAEWYDSLTLLPQALVNFPLVDKSKLALPEVEAYIAKQTSLLGDNGRLLVRASGTEPLARVMVEAPDAQVTAEVIAKKLAELTV